MFKMWVLLGLTNQAIELQPNGSASCLELFLHIGGSGDINVDAGAHGRAQG